MEREPGNARPKPMGGDQRSQHIEANGDLILTLCEATPDITLQELRAPLAEHGVAVGYGSLWRFSRRCGTTPTIWLHLPPIPRTSAPITQGVQLLSAMISDILAIRYLLCIHERQAGFLGGAHANIMAVAYVFLHRSCPCSTAIPGR